MDEKTAQSILNDRNLLGLNYRALAAKYGISRTQIHRMVMSKQKKREKRVEIQVVPLEDLALPDDVKTLREELRKARLKIELQDLMIDISSKELGIDLRKKHGTRRSKWKCKAAHADFVSFADCLVILDKRIINIKKH